jgi:hypothetical protein
MFESHVGANSDFCRREPRPCSTRVPTSALSFGYQKIIRGFYCNRGRTISRPNSFPAAGRIKNWEALLFHKSTPISRKTKTILPHLTNVLAQQQQVLPPDPCLSELYIEGSESTYVVGSRAQAAERNVTRSHWTTSKYVLLIMSIVSQRNDVTSHFSC